MTNIIVFLFVYLNCVIVSTLIYKWLCNEYYNTLTNTLQLAEKTPASSPDVKVFIKNKIKEIKVLKETPTTVKVTTNLFFFFAVIYTGIINNSTYEAMLELSKAYEELDKI